MLSNLPGAVRLLDREPRETQLHERTFIDEPLQTARFRASQLDWHEPAERLLCSSLACAILDHSLLGHSGRRQDLQVKGGLAAHQRKDLVDYIEQHLDQPLSIDALAQRWRCRPITLRACSSSASAWRPIAMCSRAACSAPPNCCSTAIWALGEIALSCGFASASHFSNRFRQAFGATPGLYRQALAH